MVSRYGQISLFGQMRLERFDQTAIEARACHVLVKYFLSAQILVFGARECRFWSIIFCQLISAQILLFGPNVSCFGQIWG